MASSDTEPPPPEEAPPRLPSHSHAGPDPTRHRIILVNPLTQDTVVVDPSSPPPSSWEPLLRALRAVKGRGRPPASRESVRAMRDVIKRTSERGREGEGEGEEEEEEEECVICMEEFQQGREMPCGHRFHGGCIERWLGMHGTCPVCRYQMPADEGAAARERWEEEEEDDEEGGEGGEGRDIWISFSVTRRNSSSEIVRHHHHLHHHYSTDRA